MLFIILVILNVLDWLRESLKSVVGERASCNRCNFTFVLRDDEFR